MSNYQYHGEAGWIKQPNRIVKTFPSGLCMIQQDYIRRKDKVDYFTFFEGYPLSSVDSEPCIDRAFVFPAPDYQDMGNGFIKCTITAYGRVNTTGTIESSLVQNRIRKNLFISYSIASTNVIVETNDGPLNIYRALNETGIAGADFLDGFTEIATRKFVIARGESIIGDPNLELRVFDESGIEVKYPINKYLGTGFDYRYSYDPSIYDRNATITREPTQSFDLSGSIRVVPILKNYQTTNFGVYTEVAATYAARFEVLSIRQNITNL